MRKYQYDNVNISAFHIMFTTVWKAVFAVSDLALSACFQVLCIY
jgi:hypothetical protein